MSSFLLCFFAPGSFAGHAIADVHFPDPEVAVEGVGRLAYPLCSQQAEKLKAVGSMAPYGQGTQTVLDPAVRRATQVRPGFGLVVM